MSESLQRKDAQRENIEIWWDMSAREWYKYRKYTCAFFVGCLLQYRIFSFDKHTYAIPQAHLSFYALKKQTVLAMSVCTCRRGSSCQRNNQWLLLSCAFRPLNTASLWTNSTMTQHLWESTLKEPWRPSNSQDPSTLHLREYHGRGRPCPLLAALAKAFSPDCKNMTIGKGSSKEGTAMCYCCNICMYIYIVYKYIYICIYRWCIYVYITFKMWLGSPLVVQLKQPWPNTHDMFCTWCSGPFSTVDAAFARVHA